MVAMIGVGRRLTRWIKREARACLGIALGAVLVGGCATGQSGSSVGRLSGDSGQAVVGSGSIEQCMKLFAALDALGHETGRSDVETVPIVGFPHLRTNRLYASLSHRADAPARVDAWYEGLSRLDRERRTIERANRPPSAVHRARQIVTAAGFADMSQAGARCRAQLRAFDLGSPERIEALRAAAGRVADSYSLTRRVLGLYPMTALGVWVGFERWKSIHLPSFERPWSELGWQGRAVHYQPARSQSTSTTVIRDMFATAERDALGMIQFDAAQIRRLAEAFAPQWMVETASGSDRLGTPVLRESRGQLLPDVDPRRPAVFVRLHHAWFEGRMVPQLVYTAWFAERPPSGVIDLLAGRLDGLVWRITLDASGEPIIADTIHPCGCYHLFFPAPGIKKRMRPEDRRWDIREPYEAVQILPDDGRNVIIRVASHSHYVTKLASAALEAAHVPSDTITELYDLVVDVIPDQALRSIALDNGSRRSLYDPNGLVSGTERAERFFLWPMGIKSAGAMRQWGHHATVFVGRRHFDDPFIIDHGFTRSP